MIQAILKIRYFQFIQIAKEIGILRGIVVLGMFFLLGIGINAILLNPQATPVVMVVVTILVFLIHMNRKDKHFVNLITNRSVIVYFTEYLILVSPVVIIYLLRRNLLGGTLPIVLILLISMLNKGSVHIHLSGTIRFLINPFVSGNKTGVNLPVSFFHPLSFEWKSGLRQFIFVLAPVYMFFLGFSYVENVGPVGFLIFSLFTTSFYMHGEPRVFLEIFKYTPIGFIFDKILRYCKYLTVLALPFVATTLVFNPSQWYFILGATIISYLIATFTILIKYALFSENQDLSKNSMVLVLHIFFLLVPFFWPVTVFSGIRFYRKAIKNLNPYFND